MSERDELVAEWDDLKDNIPLNSNSAAETMWDMGDKRADQIERDKRELERLTAENEDMWRCLGGGCDANADGDHTVITQGRYRFCGKCGESLTGVRYCHAARAALNGEGET